MLYINWKKTMENVAAALEAAQIPKSIFADRIGVSPQCLSQYLACSTRPPAEVFMRMQKELEFQIVWGLKRG